MLKLALIAVALLSPPVQAQECPALLILKSPGLSRQASELAQRYANCMYQPWLPTSEALEQKTAACHKPAFRPSERKLREALRWVDHVAAQFPGCETALRIKPGASRG